MTFCTVNEQPIAEFNLAQTKYTKGELFAACGRNSDFATGLFRLTLETAAG
jgi:hypothetical protein